MSEPFPSMSMTDEIQKISECPLTIDPRISYRSHAFCEDCLEETKEERKSGDGSFCPLCVKFSTIPDDGCDDIPRNCYVENLQELHQLFMEKSLNLIGEKRFDIPLVEQFRVRRVPEDVFMEIAWLANKIYVIHSGIKRVRVFADQTPFNELPEGIELRNLRYPSKMVANAASQSLFIGDIINECIFKIQMPKKQLSRWDIDGSPGSMSVISDHELILAVDHKQCWLLDVLSMNDGTLLESISLPREIELVVCVAQSPTTKNFVISYSKKDSDYGTFYISLLSRDGSEYIRTFDPKLFDSIQIKEWFPYYFAIKDDGQIFVAECAGHKPRVFLLNSQMTDYQIILNNDYEGSGPSRIVYIKEKQQLLLSDGKVEGDESAFYVSIFHLSPCGLIKERNGVATVKKRVSLKRSHYIFYNFTAKYKLLAKRKRINQHSL